MTLKWLRSVYSESDGTGSSTRVHIGLLTTFVIGVGITFATLVCRKVVTIEQFDSFLGAGATFLVSTTGPLYGINKLADWASNKKGTTSGATAMMYQQNAFTPPAGGNV